MTYLNIPAAGLFFTLCSAITFSFQGLCAKLISDVHILETLAISSFISLFPFCAIYVVIKRVPVFGVPEERFQLFLRCLTGSLCIGCLYASFSYIPLSDATTIRFTEPIFVNVLAFLFLKEKFGLLQVVTSMLTVLGVVIMGRPSFIFPSNESDNVDSITSKDQLIGVVLAMLASFAGAASTIPMRKLEKTPVACTCMWYSISGIILSMITLPWIGEVTWPTGSNTWMLLIGVGTLSIMNQIFITMALKSENAGPVAVVKVFSACLSFVYEITILDGNIELTSIIGASIIFACVILIGLSKFKEIEMYQLESEAKKMQDSTSLQSEKSNIESISMRIEDYIYYGIEKDKNVFY